MGATTRGIHVPQVPPGPLGEIHVGNPRLMDSYRDSPGPLGVYDWAEAVAHGSVHWGLPGRASSAAAPITTASKAAACACARELTIDELRKVFSKAKRKLSEQYLPLINHTFTVYGMTTCLRKAHFLAQIGDESGELRYTAEGLKKGTKESDVYDGYKGRGLIQITWRRNYEAYGKAVHHDFLNTHKSDLELPAWATDSAGWYWVKGGSENLNDLADKNDLLAITAEINGAFNGFEDRKAHLRSAFAALGVNDCKTADVGGQAYRPFKESAVYNKRVQAFAWGCWNDPKAGKSGVAKSEAERKQGYLRFLELNKEDGKHHPNKGRHFGFSAEKMLTLALDGSK
jgi:putative chitinase